MRRILVISIMLMLLLCSCTKTYNGHDGLVEKAREEISLADIENVEIMIAGSIDIDNRSLVWFVTGNEYQAHSYFPMEFEVSEKDPSQFKFVKAYKAYERGLDVWVYPWEGYTFLINNPKCEKLLLDFGDGTSEEIVIDSSMLPQIYYTEKEPKEYTFVDADGKEI